MLLVFTVLISCNSQTENSIVTKTSTEISFLTSDSIHVYGDLAGHDKRALTILLFHQARSNARGEYGTIIPKLREQGYNVLSIDQRSGGQLFGSYNRTVANNNLDKPDYCDAYPDLEAALDYVIQQGFSGKILVWGSSYSAALVIKLAHDHPEEINAVLAFSPAAGEALGACQPNQYFETLAMPILILRPESEMEYASVKEQFELARQYDHQVYVAVNGIHGSSMLVEERTRASVSETWAVVLAFLKQIATD